MRALTYTTTALLVLCLTPLILYAHGNEEEGPVIHMSESGFSPAEVTIVQGQQVIFENIGAEEHWPASDPHPVHINYPGSGIYKCEEPEKRGEIFDSCGGVAPGETYAFTFNYPGLWYFHDHLYPQYGGLVSVTGDSSYTDEDEQKSLSTRIFSRLSAVSLKLYYSLFSDRGKEKLAQMDIQALILDESELEYWIRVFPPATILDELVRQYEKADGRSVSCHVEGHLVGRLAAEVLGTSPINGELDTRCEFGYTHGLFEGFFDIREGKDINTLMQKSKRYCKSLPVLRDQVNCLHSLGHGAMFYYDYDLPKALIECDNVFIGEKEAYLCHAGAFMENAWSAVFSERYVPGFALHTSEWIDKDDPLFPCNALPDPVNRPDIVSGCYYQQPLHMLNLFRDDKTKVVQECLNISPEYRDSCFGGIGFALLAPNHLFFNNAGDFTDEDKVISLCRNYSISDNDFRNCMSGAQTMITLVWPDSSLPIVREICVALETVDRTAALGCYEYLHELIPDV